MAESWIPKRFTVGVAQGLTSDVMVAIREAADREGVEDVREMAARLIVEGLWQRGLLDEREHV